MGGMPPSLDQPPCRWPLCKRYYLSYPEEFLMNNRVYFFDTTLRDGEQSPGATMNLQEKLRVAHQLEVLGVDIMEAGFPASSPGDFESVQRIASQAGNIQVAGLARCVPNDIDRCWEAVKVAKNP